MRIGASRRSGQTAAARGTGGASSGGGRFRVADAGDASPTRPTGGPTSIGAVDALLTVQEAPDPTARAKKAIRRATQMLDILDDLKIGLLAGGFPEAGLARLVQTVENRRDEITDPSLARVLDEIELRARVELAKRGRIAA